MSLKHHCYYQDIFKVIFKQANRWPTKQIDIDYQIRHVLVKLVGNGPRMLDRCCQTNTTSAECCSCCTSVCCVCDLWQQPWEIGGAKCDHEFRKCVDSPTVKTRMCYYKQYCVYFHPEPSMMTTTFLHQGNCEHYLQSMRMSLLVLAEMAE